MKQQKWMWLRVVAVISAIVIGVQIGRVLAQTETPTPAPKIEYQEVIVIPDILPANLANEVHKLNEQGKQVGKDSVTIQANWNMMIWLMESPGEDE